MKKAIVSAIVVIVIAAIGGWYVWGRHNKPAASSTTTGARSSTMNMSTTSGSAGANNESAQATDKVTIQNFAFSPASITVRKGTTVTWTNNDSTAHTVTENDGKDGPASSDVNPGQTYSFTYTAVGTFRYHCSIHPSMTGTVTVTE